MKRSILLVLFLTLSLCAGAQNKRIKVRSFAKSDIGDMRARTSPVLDNNKRLTALVDISFADSDSTLVFEGIVGQPVSFPGEWLVHVPEGASRLKLSMEGCKPVDYSYPAGVLPESGLVYLMDVDIEEVVKLRTLIMPSLNLSLSSPTALSYDLMLGFCKMNGGFLRIKSNFSFGLKTSWECDRYGNVDGFKGWFSGESRVSRFAVTGGYLRHLFDIGEIGSMYAYLGAGYGSRVLAWEMYGEDGNIQYVKVTPSSFQGVETDTGVIVRLGGFAVSLGMQTNSFKFYEANLGIGVMF